MINENMNKFQELRNTKKDIFNVKITFWYLIKYYIKNFFLNTLLKITPSLSDFAIVILNKDELNKIEFALSLYSYHKGFGIYNWENWFKLNDEYSLFLFHKNSLSDFNDNKILYLNFFQQVKFLFSQKNLVWEKQILLKLFWYNSLLTVFKCIINSIHNIWIFSYLEYNKYMKSIIKQYDEQNKLLRHFIDMNDEDFEREMKMLYDIFYWYDISKLYYTLFYSVYINLMKTWSFNLFNFNLFDLPHLNVESTLKEYTFKDKWLEFFFLSFYLYFEKIQKFNEKYWIKFRKLQKEQEKFDFYPFCQLIDKHMKIWLNEYLIEQKKIENNEIVR